jgi:hypothetical protein
MSLASFGFLAFIAATIVAFHLSASIVYRRFVLASANIVFIASYVDGLEQLLPLLGFLLLGYACLQLVYLQRTAVALAASIAVVLVVYIFRKLGAITISVLNSRHVVYFVQDVASNGGRLLRRSAISNRASRFFPLHLQFSMFCIGADPAF